VTSVDLPIEPTEEQLRAAWAELAKPEWGTLDDARRGHMHWALVRNLARARLMRRAGAPAVTPAQEEPAPDAPRQQRTEVQAHGPAGDARSHWGSLKVPHQLPLIDRKRAASGEREDDDE